MTHRPLAFMLALCALGWSGLVLAEDEAGNDDARADDLEITMRLIEDPDAVGPEAVTRRITLPSPAGENEPSGAPADGPEAGDMAREEFGRTRAEELRPEPLEPPRIDPPKPPRP